jgi:phospholipid-binding lipoprotein MlaA
VSERTGGIIVHLRPVVLVVAVAIWAVSGAEPAGAQSGQSSQPDLPSLTAPATETGQTLDPADYTGVLSAKGGDQVAAEPERPNTSLSDLQAAEEELAEYDPWSGFNEKTFAFNHGLDTHVIKPVAKAYDKVVPNWVQRAVRNIFENVGSVRRLINLTLQGRWNDSGQELGRFVINTLFGLGGFIDAAPSFGVAEKREADTGQTFGVWGAGPGPYLVLPLLPPLSVRDGIGFVFDVAMDPVNWVAPFAAAVGVTTEKTINDRSLNLELFQNVEETVFDLYAAVRNGYLQRRNFLVQEGRASSVFVSHERLILSGDE